MLKHAFVYVDCDARVVSIVTTKHDVEAELSIRHDYSPRRTRSPDAGYFARRFSGRTGRRSKLPPQFGHTPAYSTATQSQQNVHSKVQIMASEESTGRSRSHRSQFGRSSSTTVRRCRQPVCHQIFGMHPPQYFPGFLSFLPMSRLSPPSHRDLRPARAAARSECCPSWPLR